MKIVLTADDLGKSPSRNDAIIEAFREGYISSAGLMVTGAHLQDALEKMQMKGIKWDKIHLHLNFSTNLSKEGSNDVPLTEKMQRDAFFSREGKFKLYRGLPKRLSSIRKWRVAYLEMKAQYEKFKELSGGEGNLEHLDCHLYYNLTWPVAVALSLFTWTHKIKTVRYWGLHHRDTLRFRIMRALMWNPFVRYIPADNIDYYLSKKDECGKYDVMELYVHPNYKDGVFLDDSPSYIDPTRQRLPMPEQIGRLKNAVQFEMITWHEV